MLIKNDKHVQKFSEPDVADEAVLEAFYATQPELTHKQNSYFRITKNKICIFGPEGELRMTYKNLSFQRVLHVHQTFLYAASDANYDTVELEDEKGDLLDEFQVKQVEGLYVYNVKALLEGRF